MQVWMKRYLCYDFWYKFWAKKVNVQSLVLPSQPSKQFATFYKLCNWSSWPSVYFKVEANKEISLEMDDVILRFGSSIVVIVIEIRCLLQN
jgi:hypothetical protein